MTWADNAPVVLPTNWLDKFKAAVKEVDPTDTSLADIDPFQQRTTQRAMRFLRELHRKRLLRQAKGPKARKRR